jgi:hypothetical protein
VKIWVRRKKFGFALPPYKSVIWLQVKVKSERRKPLFALPSAAIVRKENCH